EIRVSWDVGCGNRDQWQQGLGHWIDRNLIVSEWVAGRGVNRAPGTRTNIAEVAGTFLAVGYLQIKRGGHAFAAPFLGPEEECLLLVLVVDAGDVNRAANRIAEVILLVGRDGGLEIILGI